MLSQFLIGLIIVLAMTSNCLAGRLEPVGAVPVPATNPQTTEKAELGKQLFFDRRLSGDGTMSCATCHDTVGGFGDHHLRNATQQADLHEWVRIVNCSISSLMVMSARLTYLSPSA